MFVFPTSELGVPGMVAFVVLFLCAEVLLLQFLLTVLRWTFRFLERRRAVPPVPARPRRAHSVARRAAGGSESAPALWVASEHRHPRPDPSPRPRPAAAELGDDAAPSPRMRLVAGGSVR